MRVWRALMSVFIVVSILAVASVSQASPPPTKNFRAILSEGDEVPPTASQGRGVAIFHVSGNSIEFMLIVANIENVFAAHIHVGAVGVNGPVVLFLYGNVAPGGGRIDGVISVGSGTAANLVGPLAGHPLSDLIAAIESGNAYVNVHTNDGVPPTGTGPGDFPGGEIRGQIFG